MGIKLIHLEENPVSAKTMFAALKGIVTAWQIKASVLKKHITKAPALLICIKGNAVFKNETDVSETLTSRDMVNIEPTLKHWVEGIEDGQLLLI